MATLRSERGCPWDLKQTHQSLRPFLLEETYEALEALDREDHDALPGEMGDVLFQVVFHAQIAAEAGRWDIADAIEAICEKLIRRHPHVFTPDGRPLPAGLKPGGSNSVRSPGLQPRLRPPYGGAGLQPRAPPPKSSRNGNRSRPQNKPSAARRSAF